MFLFSLQVDPKSHIVNQFVFKLKYLISLRFWSSRNTIWCRFYYWLCLSKFQSKTLNCRRRIIRRQRRKRRRRRHVRHAEKGKEQTKRNFHLSPQLVVYTLALTANFWKKLLYSWRWRSHPRNSTDRSLKIRCIKSTSALSRVLQKSSK